MTLEGLISVCLQFVACFFWYRFGQTVGRRRLLKSSGAEFLVAMHAIFDRIIRDRKLVGPEVEITNTSHWVVGGKGHFTIIVKDEKCRERMDG